MRTLKPLLSVLLFFLFYGTLFAQTSSPLMREPAINPEGTQISFSFQGDIWTVPFEGGKANRLTIHEAYESSPRWSPDGNTIAFSGGRFGNDDIFTVPADGGPSNRITYYSGRDQLYDWTHQNALLFTSNRVFQQLEWDDEIQMVSADGGTPSRFLNAVGDMPAMSPDGKWVAFVRGSCRISREEYDGPADREIWLFDTEAEEYIQLTDNTRNDFLPRWDAENNLYYLSARTGRYNLYKQAISEQIEENNQPEPQAITRFSDDGIRYFDVSKTDAHIVFERKDQLYTKKGDNANPQKLSVTLSSDYRFDPHEHKTYSADISEYEVSPNGKLTAMVIRGEVFIKPNDKEDDRAKNVSSSPYRDKDITWLNDSTVVFSSDRNGNYDLFLARSSDNDVTNIFKSLKHEVVQLTKSEEEEVEPLISPDGTKIAYRQGRGTLITARIDAEGDLSKSKTLLDGWATPEGISWSPDSQWLAYALDNLNFNSEIYIHASDDSQEPVNFSMHPGNDLSPVWSRDGSKIGFLSNRNNNDYDVWFVWLSEEDARKTEEDRKYGFYNSPKEDEDDDKKDNGDEKADDDNEKEKEVEPVDIDFERIHDRLRQVTSGMGFEGQVTISADGETFYYTSSDEISSGSDLYSTKFDGTERKRLTKGGQNLSGVSLSPDGKKLFAVKSGRLTEVNPKSGDLTMLPFSAAMTINHRKENEQIFEEAWRALNAGFYDPNFHGDDFEALKKKYKPWALSATTAQDFRYIFNWMLGQLNASHMGIYGSNPEDTQRERSGLLGIGVIPVSNGNGVEVTKVVPESPADRPQSKLQVGDVITHIEGVPIESEQNFYAPLINDVSKQVLLQVENEEGSREVVIRPTNSLNDELYDEWVQSRRELTEKYSNGRLGYVHIEGMNFTSFERFERELMASGHDKEGIVIDVRWNGGGWTTDYLMTVLNVQQHAYTVPRGATDNLQKDHTKFRQYYPFSERLPEAWWTKPSIAISNESSYSNAEIFSHAFKHLGIGKLVGMPTFGAVISTGGLGLLDGSFVRMPFRGWYVKATDENMEHGPAVPDVIINNRPDSKANGEDPQLKRAVEELLDEI